VGRILLCVAGNYQRRRIVDTVEVFSPAKLNLFLAITGRRPDGFHELLSVAAPLQWGDRLRAEATAGEGFTLACGEPSVPTDGTNLILRAARAFQAAAGRPVGARFTLEKRIPLGAGLGGGSSNAVAALRALNRLAGEPLGAAALAALAAELGSDCPLFLAEGPVVMRGRGERISPLPALAAGRLRGRRALLFKPGFPIATAWAYRRLAESGDYAPAAEAAARLAAWEAGSAPGEDLLANGLEAVAFAKFPALPVLLDRLRSRCGLAPRLSGSGSACFALLPEDVGLPAGAIAAIREAWGPSAFVQEARLA
jgi:4-diphosphocytidyl-2-C-methyl-D-erythritol kinase